MDMKVTPVRVDFLLNFLPEGGYWAIRESARRERKGAESISPLAPYELRLAILIGQFHHLALAQERDKMVPKSITISQKKGDSHGG